MTVEGHANQMIKKCPVRNIQHSERTRKLAVNLFLLLTCVYILTASGNSVDVTDDGMIRFAITQSLIEKGTFDLPAEIGRKWGIQGRDGCYYTNHGLGQSVLAAPFFYLGKWTGNPKFMISMMGPLVTAASCSVLFLLGLRIGYSIGTAAFVSLMAGLCTQMWPESKSPFDHSLETLSCILSIYWVFIFLQDKKRGSLLLAGASLGLAVLTRVTAVLWLIPLALMASMAFVQGSPRQLSFARLLKPVALFFAGFAPFLGLVFWYNQIRFGSSIEAGYSVWARQRGISNFSNPAYLGVIGELFSPGKGVFVYCPLLILGIFASRVFYHRNRPIAVLTFSATIMYTVFFSTYVAWHGDLAWGPRYLTFLMPLWILAIGSARGKMEYQKSVYWSRMRGILIGLSCTIQLTAVMVDMNLHYFRLLRLGIIQDVETYRYPMAIYLNPRFSPLVDRFAEVGQMLGLTRQNHWLAGNSCIAMDGLTPSLDFWWWHNWSKGMPPILVLALMSPFVFEIVLCTYRIRNLLRLQVAAGLTNNQG